MELNIGGKITLGENRIYIIVDKVTLDSENYLLCGKNNNGKYEPAVLKYILIDGKYKVKEVNDENILFKVGFDVLLKENPMLLEKIIKGKF